MSKTYRFINNFIDTNLKSKLIPLYLIQCFFVFQKYNICDNSITPNSYVVVFLSICSAFFYSFVTYLRNSLWLDVFSDLIFVIFYLRFEVVFKIFDYVIICILNILYRSYNIDIILHVQKILNVLPCRKNIFSNNTTWFRIILLLLFHIMYISANHISFELNDTFLIFATIGYIFSDINIMYYTANIKMLNDLLDLWIYEMTNLKIRSNDMNLHYERRMFNETGSKMLYCYKYILRSFTLISKISQIYVSILNIIFIWCPTSWFNISTCSILIK